MTRLRETGHDRARARHEDPHCGAARAVYARTRELPISIKG